VRHVNHEERLDFVGDGANAAQSMMRE